MQQNVLLEVLDGGWLGRYSLTGLCYVLAAAIPHNLLHELAGRHQLGQPASQGPIRHHHLSCYILAGQYFRDPSTVIGNCPQAHVSRTA